MFKPNYQITNNLLESIKKINELKVKINQKKLSKVVFFELEKKARQVSSFASTSIEGNPLPLTEVKKILKNKPKNIRDSEKEVLNYNQALLNLDKNIFKKEYRISKKLICQIQSQVTQGLLPKSQVGKFRQHPVVVNDPKTGKTVFLPPNHQEVEKLIKQLADFVNQNLNKIDPVILAGLFHKQMVLIHPFMDGNGRTTRLLTKLVLAKMGLNTFRLFSFENYYNKNVTNYFKHVGEVGDYYEVKDQVDFTLWLEYFAEGIIDEIYRVQKHFPKILKPSLQLKKHHQKILKYLEKNQTITDQQYAQLTDRAKATRVLDFNFLIKKGLVKRKGKGRGTYYVGV